MKISEENLRLVEIHASFYTQDGYLRMSPWGIPPEIEGGWAKFVKIQSVTDEKNNPISYTWNSVLKRWKLEIDKNSKINVSYVVELSHDSYNWDAGGGVDGRPTVWEENTLFWATSALFIYSGDELHDKAKITFDLPKSWKISTSWVKASPATFSANNIDELTFNLLMIGKHQERMVQHDQMSITIATPNNFKHRIDLIEESLANILPAYKDIFGELPRANYLVCASKNSIQDGEAYTNSFHQMFLDKDLEYTKMVWANTLAHEMFHYWNGTHFIYSDDYEANYWFSEGFTNYYSSLTLIRTGIVSEEEYLRFLAFQFSRLDLSQPHSKERISLVEAGKQKINNWHFIYGGGTSIAFILDVKIRSITKGTKSLDDFMKVLYSKYGKLKKPINIKVQIEELNKLTNVDFKPFFDQYISGSASILEAVLKACDEAGLSVAHFQNEFYLHPRKSNRTNLYQSIIAKNKAN
jgi:predicted metalloprotease with PDZ domain